MRERSLLPHGIRPTQQQQKDASFTPAGDRRESRCLGWQTRLCLAARDARYEPVTRTKTMLKVGFG
jgi:hypothetical protein